MRHIDVIEAGRSGDRLESLRGPCAGLDEHPVDRVVDDSVTINIWANPIVIGMNRPAAWLLGSRKSSSRKLFGVALMAASALRVIRLLAIVGRESMMLIGVMTCDKPSMMTWPPPNRTSAWYRALRNKPARSLSVRVASLPSMRLRKSNPPQSPGDGAGGVRSGLTPMPVVSWIEVTMTLLSGIPQQLQRTTAAIDRDGRTSDTDPRSPHLDDRPGIDHHIDVPWNIECCAVGQGLA